MIINHLFSVLTKILINELQSNNMTNIYSNKLLKIILQKLKDKIINNSNNDISLMIEAKNKK